MAEHNDRGKWGEDMAARYLINKGYAIRERDWKFGKRDLDIIAITGDGTMMVVVEVKTRSHNNVAEPEQAVDRRKIKNIGIATNAYIKEFAIDTQVRFDIVSIVGKNENNMRIEHIENAFNPLLL